MKPYKPESPAETLVKTDGYHRGMRQAYRQRNANDKSKDAAYRKSYYRKNRSQILVRQRQSRKLHPSTAVLSKYIVGAQVCWLLSKSKSSLPLTMLDSKVVPIDQELAAHLPIALSFVSPQTAMFTLSGVVQTLELDL